MSGVNVTWDPSDPFQQTGSWEAQQVRVQWDYQREVVVGDDVCSLFDSTWTYLYNPGSPLPWHLSRCPGDLMYVQESAVPELVRLAVLVAS